MHERRTYEMYECGYYACTPLHREYLLLLLFRHDVPSCSTQRSDCDLSQPRFTVIQLWVFSAFNFIPRWIRKRTYIRLCFPAGVHHYNGRNTAVLDEEYASHERDVFQNGKLRKGNSRETCMHKFNEFRMKSSPRIIRPPVSDATGFEDLM